jgi:hypothetical protein
MFTADEVRGAAGNFGKLKITGNTQLICFIRFKAVERDHIGALTFDTRFPDELPTAASRAGWIPCWFLPWASARIIKLKIPDVTTTPVINFGGGIDPIPNPDLFFTAGINGCSVFAVGDARTPSMYHGGIDPGSGIVIPRGDDETTETMWRRLIGRQHTAKFVGSVGKTDYISELQEADTTDDGNRVRRGGMVTTRRAAELEALLEAKGSLSRVSVAPWGAVFGLRDAGGNWTMTLVQNATATYMRVIRTVKKRFLRSDKVTETLQGETEPNRVGQPIGHSYNLGFKEFFPGAGAVQVRNVDVDQIF